MSVVGVWIWTVSSPEETDSHTEEYAQVVSGVDVAVEVGDIELTAADGTSLEMVRETRWRGDEPETAESWHGEAFTAVGDCAEDLAFWPNVSECQVDYALALPSGTAAEAETSVGDIVLDGLDGAVVADTEVGDIEGNDLRATEIDVETSVGSISLEFAQVLGDINVTTDTGDVEIIVPDDGTTYSVVFESGVGSQSIDIATDASTDADYVINVTAGVGDLEVRYAG
jgi:hypothetical protein